MPTSSVFFSFDLNLSIDKMFSFIRQSNMYFFPYKMQKLNILNIISSSPGSPNIMSKSYNSHTIPCIRLSVNTLPNQTFSMLFSRKYIHCKAIISPAPCLNATKIHVPCKLYCEQNGGNSHPL